MDCEASRIILMGVLGRVHGVVLYPHLKIIISLGLVMSWNESDNKSVRK